MALTVLAVAILPPASTKRAFRTVTRRAGLRFSPTPWRVLSLLVLLAVILHGARGPADPARNALPLLIWPVFWMALVSVQALIFDIWHWMNPFAPLVRRCAPLRLPPSLGRWPAVGLFVAFTAFLLAHPEASDPRQLARLATGYLVATAVGGFLFGPRWLMQAEVLTVVMRAYRLNAPLGRARLGLWGWRTLRGAAPPLSVAVLLLTLLAGGSFDGLYETFFWLGAIGVNPLEFPGRSAVVVQTVAGLLAFNGLLLLVYVLALWLGLRVAQCDMMLHFAFRLFAPSLLPIAAVYHVAHYLVSFLIESQWLLIFFRGSLGFDAGHVATGFLGTLASVRTIWLTQAGLVVGGHVVAVILAHALALRHLPPDRAWRVLVPLSALMIAYTLFGLWLLAAPRGI